MSLIGKSESQRLKRLDAKVDKALAEAKKHEAYFEEQMREAKASGNQLRIDIAAEPLERARRFVRDAEQDVRDARYYGRLKRRGPR